VTRDELKPPVDPREFLKMRLAEASIPQAVGLLTSADLEGYGDDERTGEGITVRSLATVGLANALRVGDLPRLPEPVGTINLFCQVSRPLSKEAFLEALSLASEARTTALLESGVLSAESGLPATGTGTDCIVIAAPLSGETLCYAGKHTLAGHLLGASALEAVRSGMKTGDSRI
jgi:adenosylcobinamide amidohydrolase